MYFIVEANFTGGGGGGGGGVVAMHEIVPRHLRYV